MEYPPFLIGSTSTQSGAPILQPAMLVSSRSGVDPCVSGETIWWMHGTFRQIRQMLYLDIKTVTGGSNLVGGFNQPLWKVLVKIQNGFIFPKYIEVKIPKNIGNHHLVMFYEGKCTKKPPDLYPVCSYDLKSSWKKLRTTWRMYFHPCFFPG